MKADGCPRLCLWRRVLLSSALGLAVLGVLAQSPVPVTNIVGFKALSRDEASRLVPTRFQGVVTGGNPLVRDLFVQDGDAAAYLAATNIPPEVQIGDWVEVEGVSHTTVFNKLVIPQRVQSLGTRGLPAPVAVTAKGMLETHHEGSRVVVEGLVRTAERDLRYRVDPPIVLRLALADGDVSAAVWKRGVDDWLLGLPGSVVAVSGICTPAYNQLGQAVRAAMLVTARDEVRVLTTGSNPRSGLPRTRVRDLLVLEGARPPGQLVRVEGVVTAVLSRSAWFVQDESGAGVRVRSRSPVDVAVGDGMGLVGLPKVDSLPPQSMRGPPDPSKVSYDASRPVYDDQVKKFLDRAVVSFSADAVEKLGAKLLPAPRPVTEESIGQLENAQVRVSLEAVLSAATRLPGRPGFRFNLTLGSISLEAFAPAADASASAPPVGSRVQVTGVLDQLGDRDAEDPVFRFYMGSLADLTLLALPPNSYFGVLLWSTVGVSAAGGLVLAWALTLRRVVRVRTAELARVNRDLERASSAKGQFLANMSHEIRTPMHAALGLLEVLQKEPLSPGQREIVKRVALAGRSLMRLLNDILDLSKMETGHLALEVQPFELNALLATVDTLFAETARLKGLNWRVDRPDPPVGTLRGDPFRVEQVLGNLLSNAIKFTRQGGVCLRARVLQTTATEARLRFEVSDTGPGIEPAAQARLFRPFVQADAGISRQYGGTGLGLAISRSLVDQMGGTLGVDSKSGEGSTFWMELAFEMARAGEGQPAPAGAGAPEAGERLRGRTFLVVDDNPLNLDLLELALRQEGAIPVLVSSGRDCLACLGAEPGRFDAVLMDIQMPDLGGLETTRAIRQQLGLLGLPILAVSAGVLPEQKEAALAAGVSDFLPKPFEMSQLLAALQPWLKLHAGNPTENLASAPQSGPPDSTDWGADFPQLVHLDVKHAARRLNNDPAFFRDCLRRFQRDFASLPTELGLLWQDGASDELLRRLHRLRGIAGFLGALELGETAVAVEGAIRASAPDTEGLLATLATELGGLLEEIRQLDPPGQHPGEGDPDLPARMSAPGAFRQPRH